LHDDDFVRSLHATTLPSLSDHSFKGDKLTPDDRTRITSNIRGYDISPDMVRLSLVNLYLHGFPEPHIYEYDSLTSEDRWNEFYDVILANPPFMSPKGGIRPHKRFSVQSNRSEVLFVDLMAEHLTPGGRAAIVVPEGIIFQSGTAYKSLRKMLVDDFLVGVISLPAGVFNPYSGVKTSILWLDKSLARKTNQILFAKITADGFDLGAQRRPVKQNDLPGAFRAIQQYIDFLQIGSMPIHDDIDDDSVQSLHDDDIDDDSVRTLHATSRQGTESTLQSIYPHITLVAKSAIAENGDYNLSGERYKINALISSQYEFVKLGEVCEINPKKSELKAISPDLEVSFVPMQDVSENSIRLTPKDSRKLSDVIIGAYTYFTEGDVLLAKVTPCFENGKAGIAKNLLNNIGFGSSELFVIRPSDLFKPEFIYYMVSSSLFKDYAIPKMTGTGGLQRVPKNSLEEFQIPLPPLSIQQEIVAEIEAYQKIIDGARQVVENYKPRITIDPDWEMVELGEVFTKVNENVIPSVLSVKAINYIGLENISQGIGEIVGEIYSNPQDIKSAKIVFRAGDVLYGKLRPNLNKVYYSEIEGICSTDIFVIRGKENIIPKLYSYYFLSDGFNHEVLKGLKGAQLPRVGYESFSSIQIPLPPLEIQQQIVEQIEREQALVNANKELIALFEQKIKDRIARVWGE
jgi:type I restriction enzyme M protein